MSVSPPKNAIVTASYSRDLARCEILCETIDARVDGHDVHYILVEPNDVGLFRALEGPKRVVVDERDILPSRLMVLPDPLKLGRRKIWVGARVMPLHGWQVQQLRRIAIAEKVPEDALLYCDSDTAFVRRFDLATLWRDGALRLYRKDDGLAAARDDHQRWVEGAARAFGLPRSRMNGHDYVSTHVSWRADTVRAMSRHMEAVHGARNWMEVVARSRRFSECMLYGHYVDDVTGGVGHFADGMPLCHIHWFEPPPSSSELADWIARIDPRQVAVGIQSYLALDPREFRKALGL